jgi:hypothetical protein
MGLHQFPKGPYAGKGWIIDFVLPFSKYPPASEMIGNKVHIVKEVVIRAKNEVVAQRAADIIHASRLLLEGCNLSSQLYPGEHAPIFTATDKLKLKAIPWVETASIPLACLVAAKASRKLEYIYALAKIRLSLETFSLPTIQLDPHHSENIPKSPLPEDHVRMAFSIVTAWSAVEELGFDVRASQKNPSKLPDGSWNPIIKQELESRLTKGHVNLKEPVSWNLRGPRTKIEKEREPSITKKAPWARYQVRDGEMAVIDAINYVSFLRSRVSAHKSDKDMLRVLSPYEVANAQFLVRRLFLEKIGFWRYLGPG